MAANISINPLLTTVASGTFSVASDGFVQGTQMDDPAVRYALCQGILNSSETLPMWGGIAIYEDIPYPFSVTGGLPTHPLDNLGSLVGRAASNTAIAGFSVFNQAPNWITSPQSQAPSAGVGMSVPYYRLGSGARIAVQCDPSLASLEGGATNQQVSWDINNQLLAPYDASTGTIAITGATWASTNGGQISGTVANWTGAWQPGAGDLVTISGATNSGTGGAAAVNTTFAVVSATATTFVLAAPAASGVIGTIGGSPVFNFGTGALNVKVLGFNFGNSKIVTYDAVNNYVNWNGSGSCALILL